MANIRSGLGRWLPAAVITLAWALHPVAAAAVAEDTLEQLEVSVVRAEDLSAIRKLQRAYGYYADRGLWDDLADLFADDAVANYPSGGFDGNASIRAMFVKNLGQGKAGLADGRIYNHTILQPVVDLAADGATATGRWRVLGMLGRFPGSATWADSLYRFDYVKQSGRWKIRQLTAYAGSGGGYEQGWVPPRPRPAGAADTSPIRFNLAHPADRPWIDPCEADVSVCVVPFPYPNRSEIRMPATAAAVGRKSYRTAAERAADLVRRAQRLQDEQAVLNLQRAWGYYIDGGKWRQAANLFAPDGTREVGQSGVYVGRERIFRLLSLQRPKGLLPGELNDHLQLEPIVDVAPDGLTARGRIFEMAFVGGGGEPQRLVQNVAQNEYVRRDGVWMIKAMHVYTILATAYEQGWGRSALSAPVVNQMFPPDRPPTVVYAAYPAVFTPPLHFTNPAKVSGVDMPVDQAAAMPADRQIAAALNQARQALDYFEIDNLQSAYGYYAEKSLWTDISRLFAADGVLQVGKAQHKGHDILEFLKQSGPEGPVKGALDSQLQLQPVIHIAADGRSARLRSRLLELTRDASGRPMWGGGIYENELVKEGSVWKFRRMNFLQTYKVDYRAGWATKGEADGQILPTGTTLPFHYRNPVSAK